MNTATRLTPLLLVGLGLPACFSPPLSPTELVEKMDEIAGTHVRVKAKVESGAKCHLATEDGKWQTYCGDCQVCEGPLVLRLGGDQLPVVLSGVFEGKKMGCAGKLGEVECHPFAPGEVYVVEGLFERGEPAKLIVDRYALAP